MAELILDANTFGSFYISAGNTGEDDHVTLTIGEGFSGTITVDSSNNDNEIETLYATIPNGWTLDLEGESFDTFESPNWIQRSYSVLDENGDRVGQLLTRTNNTSPVCFASETLIDTPRGEIAIECLNIGDEVLNINGKPCKIRWISHRHLSRESLVQNVRLRPIKIAAGSLAKGLPKRDLVVSRQHRIMASSTLVAQTFNTNKVLIAANKLVELPGVAEAIPKDGITFIHLLFDEHEIIHAEGVPAESLLLGEEALFSLCPLARGQLKALVPSLFANLGRIKPACLIPSNKQQKQFCKKLANSLYDVLENNTIMERLVH